MAMTPDGVIKHLDVIKYVSPGVFPDCVDPARDTLTLKELEKTLNNRIVIAVTTPAHADSEVVSFQEVLPIMACELTALVVSP